MKRKRSRGGEQPPQFERLRERCLCRGVPSRSEESEQAEGGDGEVLKRRRGGRGRRGRGRSKVERQGQWRCSQKLSGDADRRRKGRSTKEEAKEEEKDLRRWKQSGVSEGGDNH